MGGVKQQPGKAQIFQGGEEDVMTFCHTRFKSITADVSSKLPLAVIFLEAQLNLKWIELDEETESPELVTPTKPDSV